MPRRPLAGFKTRHVWRARPERGRIEHPATMP